MSTKPPSLRRGMVYKVASAATTMSSALKEAVLSGNVKADPNLISKRLEVCAKCDKFSGTTCSVCGCFMQFKTALITAKCPLKKW